MSIQIKPALLISIAALMFCFGCTHVPREIISAPEPPQEEGITPQAPQPPTPEEEVELPGEPEEPEQAVAPPEETPMPRSTVPEAEKTDKTSSRTTAALRLTEQAQLMLSSNRPDNAIVVLERAMNIDPTNGRNYYYLAEAWIMKGNRVQALEFNRMAGIHLGSDEGWKDLVTEQKGRIEKMH